MTLMLHAGAANGLDGVGLDAIEGSGITGADRSRVDQGNVDALLVASVIYK